MIFDRKELSKKLDIVKNAMNYKSMYDYGNYLIIDNKRISIYDGDVFLSVPTEEDISIALHAREFISFVGKVSGNIIDLEIKEGHVLLKCGRNNVKLFSVDENKKKELISMLPVIPEQFSTFPQDFFTKLKKIESIPPKKKDVKVVPNFYIEGKNVVATDGLRFGKVILDDYLATENNFFLNFFTAKIIQKYKMNFFNVEEDYQFYINDDNVVFGIAEENGLFPDYVDYLDNEEGIEILFPDELIDDIGLTSIFNINVSSLDKKVDISVFCDRMIMSGDNAVGNMSAEYNVQNDNEIKFSVHPGLFIAGLKYANKAIFNPEMESLLFVGDDFRYVINVE